ncbi:MAG: GGDEF domain-containing protein [Candidatus Limnocylindria bacterium]
MQRSSATRASRTTLGLLVAGSLLTVLLVARTLPSADLAEAGLAWTPDALAGLLAVVAAVTALAWLVAGLRSGRLADLLTAGASATIAGGALSLLSDASPIVTLGMAALALAGAGVADRAGLEIRGQLPRIATAVAIIGLAEIAVLAELLPGLGGGASVIHPAVAGGMLAVAVVAALIGLGTQVAPMASAVLVGIAAASLAREGGIETVIGLLALIGSQLIGIVTWAEASAPAAEATEDEGDRLPELAGRLADAVLRFDGGLRLRDWNATATVLLGLDQASRGARLEDLLGVAIGELPRDDGSVATVTGVGDLTIGLQRSGGGLTAIIRDPVASPESERLGRELRGTIEELLQARRTIDLQRQEIERAATIDALTGVASRVAIMERLRIEVAQARRYQHRVGIALIDIDGFADLNRTHGTAGGDTVLREIALRMRLRVREADELGRIGSDTFLAVLPHTEEGGAATFADAIQHRLALRPVGVGDAELRITASVGVAVLRSGEDLDVDGLLARATEALASAKRAGGNRIALDRLHGLARLEDHQTPDGHPHDSADDAAR